MTRLARGAAAAAAAMVAALAAQAPRGAVVVLLGALALGVDVVLLRRTSRRAHTLVADPLRFAPVLAGCWLAVTLPPMHDFTGRSAASAVSSVSPQALAELAIFGAVGLVALHVLRSLPVAADRATPPAVALALPVWVMASTVWAATSGPYALVRGSQLGVIALLGWATSALGVHSRDALDEVVWAVLRWFVRAILVLTALGAVFGPRYTAIGSFNLGRFTWPGAHPTAAGTMLAVALLIVVTAPGRRVGLAPALRVAAAAALVAALWSNHSRAAWVSLLAAALVCLWVGGRRWPLLRVIGVPYVFAATLLAITLFGSTLLSYALRGGSTDRLTSLNNRTQLWSIGADALRGVVDWSIGLGYGAARVVFLPQASFAGEAHSSALSLLVSVGVVGLALVVVLLARVVRDAVRNRIIARTTWALPLVAVLAYTVVQAVTSDLLAEPGFGTGVLYLAGAAAAAVGATMSDVCDDGGERARASA